MVTAASLIAVPQGAPLHLQVVDALGQLIVGAGYGPGSQLPNEEALCQQFNVSRTAVREAIKVLGAKGLVEARPRAGTRVRPFAQWSLFDADVLRWLHGRGQGHELVPHLTVVREMVEPTASALAAREHTAAQAKELAAAYAQMEAATHIEAWVPADLRFHQAILQATNNPFLISLGGMIATALEGLLVVNAEQARQFNDALPAHRKVLQAILARNPDDAGLWMRALLADARVLGRATSVGVA